MTDPFELEVTVCAGGTGHVTTAVEVQTLAELESLSEAVAAAIRAWQEARSSDPLEGHVCGQSIAEDMRRMSDAAQPEGLTAAQIADRWERVTAARVGQMVRLLGLVDIRAIDGRNEYSPAAVGLIERELRSRGYRLRRPPP